MEPATTAPPLHSGMVARIRGMTELGLGRKSLYKAFSGENNTSFGAIAKVCVASGAVYRDGGALSLMLTYLIL
jgi:probable addiction module antidote protein